MSSTESNTKRRHERRFFTPAEVIATLQHIGGMSPIEMLASGYVNIPAVTDDLDRVDAPTRAAYAEHLESVSA